MCHYTEPTTTHCQCSVLRDGGELLARAAFIHHDDQGQVKLSYHAIFKGFRIMVQFMNFYEHYPVSTLSLFNYLLCALIIKSYSINIVSLAHGMSTDTLQY